MDTWDPETYADAAADLNDAILDAVTDGDLFRFYRVALDTQTKTGGNDAHGKRGATDRVERILTPRPRVTIKKIYRNVHGQPQAVGDAEISALKTAATMADFLAASWVELSGQPGAMPSVESRAYDVVGGFVKETAFSVILVLKERVGVPP